MRPPGPHGQRHLSFPHNSKHNLVYTLRGHKRHILIEMMPEASQPVAGGGGASATTPPDDDTTNNSYTPAGVPAAFTPSHNRKVSLRSTTGYSL
ncbi:MAG: hypothetical protein WCJ40_14335 [Planctomycetota bacterium]